MRYVVAQMSNEVSGDSVDYYMVIDTAGGPVRAVARTDTAAMAVTICDLLNASVA